MDKNQHIPAEQFEEMERFLQHQMQEDEEQAFLSKMATDPDLKDKVDELKFIFTGIQEASLEKKLAEFHTGLLVDMNNGTKKPVVKLFSLKKWLVAASVITVLAVSSWLVFFKPVKEDNLFADYFRPDPGLISAMSNNPGNYTFDRAMIEYKIGNYDTAINSWKVLLKTAPSNDTLNYFIASAYLAKNESSNAIPYFKKVVLTGSEAFLSETYWYLGLSLLKERKTKEAITFLEKTTHKEKDSLLLRLKK